MAEFTGGTEAERLRIEALNGWDVVGCPSPLRGAAMLPPKKRLGNSAHVMLKFAIWCIYILHAVLWSLLCCYTIVYTYIVQVVSTSL